MKPFNPVERAKKAEELVVRGNERKYYRFRYTRYYGGIVTADTVGCNLLCAYCWNYFKNLRPEKYGEFYSSEEVANKLLEIAKAKGCYLFRISGAEPILGKNSAKHVAEVISRVGRDFILETNGLMFGYSPDLVDYFSGLSVVVRITVKGWDERGIPFWVAVMYDVFGEEGVETLRKKLPIPCRIEYEYLEAYPFVLENLRKRGVRLKD